MNDRHVAPGWPGQVPPPSTPGWERAATAWLLDRCPADYRAQGVWQRHPVALGWVATRHVEGQVQVMRDAYRQARVDLGDHVDGRVVTEVLAALEAEGLRLRADARAAALVRDALHGMTFTPRL